MRRLFERVKVLYSDWKSISFVWNSGYPPHEHGIGVWVAKYGQGSGRSTCLLLYFTAQAMHGCMEKVESFF